MSDWITKEIKDSLRFAYAMLDSHTILGKPKREDYTTDTYKLIKCLFKHSDKPLLK